MRQRLRIRHLLLVAGLLLLAYALRLYRLDHQSLWWDEGISLHLATSSVGEIIRDRQNNIHPPLYFFILKGWLALVGVSAFTGRYLSAMASLGQVAIVYSAVRYWSKGGGKDRALLSWLAAFFMLIAPLSIIYGQEIRVYALLPFVYVLALLLAEIYLSDGRPPLRILVFLAVVEWVGLHLHYIAIFAVAYIGIWGVTVLYRSKNVSSFRRWVVAHVLVAVASLPWLVGVIRNWAAIQAEANAGTFTTSPVPFGFLVSQVWAFQLTGLAGALSSDFVRVTSTVALILFAGLLVFRAAVNQRARYTKKDGDAVFRLVTHWIVPLGAGLAVWSVRSFSHPRYITMFAVMLIPAAVFLMVRNRHRVPRAAAAGLAVCMVLLSFWGLGRYFFSEGAAKPDMRGVARHLESITQAGDLILVPDTDWSLPFEYRGEATILMPRVDESPFDATTTLTLALDCPEGPPCAESGRVFTVEYERGTRDWQDRLSFELARRGYRAGVTHFDDLSIGEYRLTGPSGSLPGCESQGMTGLDYSFGSLALEAAWLPSEVASDTAVPVALCWRLNRPVASGMTASLILSDPITGERMAQSDTLLLDSAGAPSHHWPVGESIITYHLLPLSQGTPPIEGVLQAGVYDDDGTNIGLIEAFDSLDNPAGQLIHLGEISLGSPVGLSSSAYDAPLPPLWDVPVEVTNGLELAGTFANPGPYRPGQTIRVGLTWRPTDELTGSQTPVLLLEQGGEILDMNADLPVNGRYPVERWQTNQLVFEYRDVRVPAGAEGSAELTIQAGENRISLGQIEIEGSAILFDKPTVHTPANARFGDAISLTGFKPPAETLETSSPIPLTLYWESLTGQIPTGYVVFTHLLANDGRLIAQHDSPPANGQRPTDEWLMGEFIIDPHELEWREMNYGGPARLSVGFYDPTTGERLITADGADSFILPVSFIVEPAP